MASSVRSPTVFEADNSNDVAPAAGPSVPGALKRTRASLMQSEVDRDGEAPDEYDRGDEKRRKIVVAAWYGARAQGQAFWIPTLNCYYLHRPTKKPLYNFLSASFLNICDLDWCQELGPKRVVDNSPAPASGIRRNSRLT